MQMRRSLVVLFSFFSLITCAVASEPAYEDFWSFYWQINRGLHEHLQAMDIQRQFDDPTDSMVSIANDGTTTVYANMSRIQQEVSDATHLIAEQTVTYFTEHVPHATDGPLLRHLLKKNQDLIPAMLEIVTPLLNKQEGDCADALDVYGAIVSVKEQISEQDLAPIVAHHLSENVQVRERAIVAYGYVLAALGQQSPEVAERHVLDLITTLPLCENSISAAKHLGAILRNVAHHKMGADALWDALVTAYKEPGSNMMITLYGMTCVIALCEQFHEQGVALLHAYGSATTNSQERMIVIMGMMACGMQGSERSAELQENLFSFFRDTALNDAGRAAGLIGGCMLFQANAHLYDGALAAIREALHDGSDMLFAAATTILKELASHVSVEKKQAMLTIVNEACADRYAAEQRTSLEQFFEASHSDVEGAERSFQEQMGEALSMVEHVGFEIEVA